MYTILFTLILTGMFLEISIDYTNLITWFEWSNYLLYTIIFAGIEELIKICWAYMGKSTKEFDELWICIIISCLTFATYENFLYYQQSWMELLLIRLFPCTLIHISTYIFYNEFWKKWFLIALIIHIMYNYFVVLEWMMWTTMIISSIIILNPNIINFIFNNNYQ